MAIRILTNDAREVEAYENNNAYFNESNDESFEESKEHFTDRREKPRLPINWWNFAKIVLK
jgi:hypothetical protein